MGESSPELVRRLRDHVQALEHGLGYSTVSSRIQCEAADEIERLRLRRFTVRVEQDGQQGEYHRYTVECHGQDDAKLLAFALDGGWGAGEDASGMLELAKMYCDIEAAKATEKE